MKKICVSSISLIIMLSALCAGAFAAMPFAPKETIVLHIGPKNPTFDESKYPDIVFYYTPSIKWTDKKVSGTPALLAKWMNDSGLRVDEGILTDKNGLVAFTCFLMPDTRIEDNMILGDFDNLGGMMRKVVERNEAVFDRTSQPIEWDKVSGINGRKFPEFEIVNASGKTTSTTAVISAGNEPKLIYVMKIPYDHQFKSAEESMKNVVSPMQALSGMVNMSVTDERTDILNRIQNEIYCRSVN